MLLQRKKANSFVPAIFSPWHGLFRKKGGTGAGIRFYFPCLTFSIKYFPFTKKMWEIMLCLDGPTSADFGGPILKTPNLFGSRDSASGKSKRGLSKRGLGPNGANWPKRAFRGNLCSSFVAVRCGGIGPDRPRKSPDLKPLVAH